MYITKLHRFLWPIAASCLLTTASAAPGELDFNLEPEIDRIQEGSLELSASPGESARFFYTMGQDNNPRIFPIFSLVGFELRNTGGFTPLLNRTQREIAIPPLGRDPVRIRVALNSLLAPNIHTRTKTAILNSLSLNAEEGRQRIHTITPRTMVAKLALKASSPSLAQGHLEEGFIELASTPFQLAGIANPQFVEFFVDPKQLSLANGVLADDLQVQIFMYYRGRLSRSTASVQVSLLQSAISGLKSQLLTKQDDPASNSANRPVFFCAPKGEGASEKWLNQEIRRLLKITISGRVGEQGFNETELNAILDRLLDQSRLVLESSIKSEKNLDEAFASIVVGDQIRVRDTIGNIKKLKSMSEDEMATEFEKSLNKSWDNLEQLKSSAKVDTDFNLLNTSVDVSVAVDWLSKNKVSYAEAAKNAARTLRRASNEFEGNQPNLVGMKLDQKSNWSNFSSFESEITKETYTNVVAMQMVRLSLGDLAVDTAPYITTGKEVADLHATITTRDQQIIVLKSTITGNEVRISQLEAEGSRIAIEKAKAEADLAAAKATEILRMERRNSFVGDGKFFRTPGNGTVYFVEAGRARPIDSPRALEQRFGIGTNDGKIQTLPSDIDMPPIGETITYTPPPRPQREYSPRGTY